MHKPAELVDVTKQVQAHLEQLDLRFNVELKDLGGRTRHVPVYVHDGLAPFGSLGEIPLMYLLARDQPWRGHADDDANVGAITVLAPWTAEPGRRPAWYLRRALASAAAFGAVEPVENKELIDDIADQVRDAAYNINIEYENWGPERRREDATSMLRVEVSSGAVTIIEWQHFEAATGEQAEEGAVTRQEARVELVELMDRGARHRDHYSGDNPNVGIVDVLVGGNNPSARVREADRERMIVNTAISYLGYYGGEESWVDELGDD